MVESKDQPGDLPNKAQGFSKRREPDFDLSSSANIVSSSSPKPSQPVGNAPEQTQLPRAEASSGIGSKGLYLVVILFFGYAVFSYLELAAVKQQLAEAQQALSNMNMLTEAQYGELAGSLDNAREQRSVQERELKEKLEFLDSEMRKLWVIAHQTNQPRIEKLEQSVKALVGDKGTQSKTVAMLEKSGKEMARTVSELAGGRQTLEKALATLQTKMAEVDIRLTDVPVAIEAIQRDVTDIAKRVDSVSKLKAEFDEHRQRLNRSVDQLFEEVRQLKGTGEVPGL